MTQKNIIKTRDYNSDRLEVSEEQGAIQYLQIKYCAHSQCVVSEVYVYRDEVMETTYLLYFVVTSRSDATAIRCCDQTDTSLSV